MHQKRHDLSLDHYEISTVTFLSLLFSEKRVITTRHPLCSQERVRQRCARDQLECKHEMTCGGHARSRIRHDSRAQETHSYEHVTAISQTHQQQTQLLIGGNWNMELLAND